VGSLLDLVASTLERASFWSAVDVFVVAVLVYGVLSLFRGTSGFSLLYGIALLLVMVALVSSVPNLVMLNWLLRNALPFVWLALLIVFQPELRRAMERIGRFRNLFSRQLSTADSDSVLHAINEIARTCRRMSERRHGVLIVISRDTGLQEYVDTGVTIDGIVSVELLMTIFFPNSPLHDSAVVVHGNRVVAAGCVLPLSENVLDSQLGTRHRAAVGITEITDAIAVVVSEETGTISIANNGRLVRYLDELKLRKMLAILAGPRPHGAWMDWRPRWRRRAA
jgi:diadenylate cyclase